ncbi:MAG: prenyltransferase [ANME-2 cluster archaeon]|nr:MAG: prenyltransferase [ANME-2 cluster archaeon]
MIFRSSPTLRLLNSSTPVAISGFLRLHVAFLFAGIEPKIMIYLGGGLIIYATYTLDRSLDCEEDTINRSELTGAKKQIAVTACIITFLVGAFMLAKGNIYFASFFPFIVGFLYTKGIKIGKLKLKLKGSRGGKNVVIALSWGGTIAIIVSKWEENIFTIMTIFLFYLIKLFINSVLYDFRDIKGDMAAGVQTLPVCFGKDIIRKKLMTLCFLLHAVMIISLLMGFIRPELIILSYSFLVGFIPIYLYSSAFEVQGSGIRKHLREIMIDGESTIALALRAIINSLFCGTVPYNN